MTRTPAKLHDLHPGDVVWLDRGFTCHRSGPATLHADEDGDLFFRCREGEHYLAGQLNEDDTLSGIFTTEHSP